MIDFRVNCRREGNAIWPAAKLFSECSEGEKYEANLRTIFPDEIVLDCDTQESMKTVPERLDKEGYNFMLVKSPNGLHIHMTFGELVNFTQEQRMSIRNAFIKEYGADPAKSSELTFISIPGKIHFKTKDFISKAEQHNGRGPNTLPYFAVTAADNVKQRGLVIKVAPSEGPQSIPNWLSDMIKNGADKNFRHVTEYKIIKELYFRGYDEDYITKAALTFNNACKPPKHTDVIRRHVSYLLGNAETYLKKELAIEELPAAMRIADDNLGRERYFEQTGVHKDGSPIMTFKPRLLGDDILKSYIIKTNIVSKEMFCYHDGIYMPDGASLIEQKAKQLMEWDISKNMVGEVLFHIAIKTYAKESEFVEKTRYVHIANGIYDMQANALLPFTPDIFSLNKMPVVYEPSADCPAFKTFLKEVLQEDDIYRIQEMIGYFLYKEMPFHKAFMLTGSGQNGKSTLLEAVKITIGEQNVLSIPLQQLGDRFTLINFMGKMANIHSDISSAALKDTGWFKILVGGDSITAEKKHGGFTNFKPYCKQVFSANKIPETKDITLAFFRRWEIIPFVNEFPPEKADPDILKKITTPNELSGIFNFALEGLQRLLKNRKFSNTQAPDVLEKIYMKMSDSLYAFCEDMFEIAPGEWIEKERFYELYLVYCRKNKLPSKTKELIGRELPLLRPVVTTHPRPNEDGKAIVAWSGIKLK